MIYQFIRLTMKFISNIFFSEIETVGSHNIPSRGALILCGNHSNQFIDPLMITGYCSREVSFLMAESSMSKPVVG
jgi:glycerol-3-phosphate O-acyltransferase/dihydroxyacetone phosphate acyltransferase